MVWEVRFYLTKRGESPVQEFIDSLDKRSKSKVLSMIDVLRNAGPFLTRPYMKKMRSDLYELRIKSAVAVRLFYSPITGIYYFGSRICEKNTENSR